MMNAKMFDHTGEIAQVKIMPFRVAVALSRRRDGQTDHQGQRADQCDDGPVDPGDGDHAAARATVSVAGVVAALMERMIPHSDTCRSPNPDVTQAAPGPAPYTGSVAAAATCRLSSVGRAIHS